MDKYINKKLEGRYEIKELIGVGGMANVYKAFDIVDEKIVAVKILRDEFAENEEFIKRFKTESKAISVLSHPNIVKVFDVTFTDRIQSIVMEYVDGITLKKYIEQQGILKWKEAVHFTVQILRALQHAHDKGIIHRDIKPQNIMLQQDGTIKVMDFGIARFNRTEPITATDKVIGSVHYISPEQARGEITDEKTDVYAIGVMLFEMLTGKLPFEATDPVSVALMQISDKPQLPREINPSIPEGLEDITIRAMQKDVSLRYQTASEMLRDIEEFKKNPHIQFDYTHFNEAAT
ncbi:MAG: protein kinase, partial [Clostridia bacterium]